MDDPNRNIYMSGIDFAALALQDKDFARQYVHYSLLGCSIFYTRNCHLPIFCFLQSKSKWPA